MTAGVVAKAARATRGVSNLVPGEPHTPRIVRVGLTQMACGEDTGRQSHPPARARREGAAGGAQIICTQELFRSQYFCQVEDHRFFRARRDHSRPVDRGASRRSRATHGVVVIASLFEKRAAGLYHNTAVVIDADGSLLGVYRKMHIPDDPLYYEKFYFTPGDTGFRAWKTQLRDDRRAHLLGSVVSRRRAADGDAGRGDALLPHRDRLASVGEGGVRPARSTSRGS